MLKRIGVTFLVLLTWAAARVSAAPDPNFHIYLMIGQSNMAGAGTIEAQDRNSHPKVQVMQDISCSSIATPYGQWRPATPPLIYCPGGLGPGDYFGRGMGDAAPGGVTIGLVGAAYPGAKIEYFMKDCATYNACQPPFGPVAGAPNNGTSGYAWIMDLATKAQQRGVIKGIIFHQGESNGGQSDWPSKVNKLVTSLRADLGLKANEVPFVAGELLCCGLNQYIQQIPNVVQNGHWVSAAGLKDKGDGIHFDTESNRELGRRFAAKMLEVGDNAPAGCGIDAGMPVCCSILADLDGDGFGEQADGNICVVTEDSEGWHPANPADVVAAINVGGSGASVNFSGIWYEPDHFFTDGMAHATSDPVQVPGDLVASTLFQSERYGNFAYKIPVDSGLYSVQLGMAEIFHTNPGARLFQVTLEGQRVLENVDIYQQVGHDTGLITGPFTASVNDGYLDIEVATQMDNGTLASILVRTAGSISSSSSSSSSSTSSSSSSSSSSSTSSSSSSSSNSSSSSSSSSSSGTQGTTSGGAAPIFDLFLIVVFLLWVRHTLQYRNPARADYPAAYMPHDASFSISPLHERNAIRSDVSQGRKII